MDVQGGDEVIAAWFRGPGSEVGLDPVDAPGEIRPGGLGCRSALGESGCREIDRRDLPSLRGQPERIGAVTAARIEGEAWLQAADLGGQMPVRGSMRDLIRTLAQGLGPGCVDIELRSIPRTAIPPDG